MVKAFGFICLQAVIRSAADVYQIDRAPGVQIFLSARADLPQASAICYWTCQGLYARAQLIMVRRYNRRAGFDKAVGG
jgi:hypothetical protein